MLNEIKESKTPIENFQDDDLENEEKFITIIFLLILYIN